jgi:hypothetical protein
MPKDFYQMVLKMAEAIEADDAALNATL